VLHPGEGQPISNPPTEFGIRAAIGASPPDQVKLVLGSALWMAGPGVAVDRFGALLLSWLITSSVRGLDVNSPMTYAIVGFLQLTIAVAAAAIPGRRAGRANPLAALRPEYLLERVARCPS
jgi:putative ABC transport system permease protein